MFILSFLLLFLLLFILFLLSRKISQNIYRFVYLLTKNRGFSVGVLTTVILPGTVIHELSHFVMATILRVPTGELTIIPEIEENGEVKAGKLTYASTDPFRQILIGLAPMIIGLVIIYLVGKNFLPDLSNILNTKYLILNTVGLYLLFITSITMFSSKKDLESLLIVGPLILIVAISLYITGVRIYFEKQLTESLTSLLSKNNYYLLIAAVVDLLVFLITSANLYLWQGILKRKLS